MNKNVKQAVFSPPQELENDSLLDAGISALNGLSTLICSMPISATAVLKNFGSTIISSATILCQIDNGNWISMPWTGNIPANGSALIDLSGIDSPPGLHTLKVKVIAPNGVADLYPNNNSKSVSFLYSTTGFQDPIQEGFQQSLFPPLNWTLNDIGTTGKTWTRTTSCGGFGSSTASTRIPFYSMSTIGEVDELILPPADLTMLGGAQLIFNVAYAQYNTSYIDKLKVMVSADCGLNWATVYEKQGSALATAPIATSSFVPTATQWRSDTIDLSSYTGETRVFIKFVGVNGYGNNLYLDDIQLKHLLCKIQGMLSYKNSQSSPLPNAVINLFQNNVLVQSDTTNSLGFYQFNDIIPGNYQLRPEITLPWGGGNSVDALKILKHFTGITTLTGINALAGNPDGNSVINATDALWVSKRFVGLIFTSAIGDWVSEKPNLTASGLIPVNVNLKALCTGDVDGSFIP